MSRRRAVNVRRTSTGVGIWSLIDHRSPRVTISVPKTAPSSSALAQYTGIPTTLIRSRSRRRNDGSGMPTAPSDTAITMPTRFAKISAPVSRTWIRIRTRRVSWSAEPSRMEP